MKKTLLFLATLVTAHIHGAQTIVSIPPTKKVTAVLKDVLTDAELVRITDMNYEHAQQMMSLIAREGYNSSIGFMTFDPTTNTATFSTIINGQAFLNKFFKQK